mmetsp:Transcript_16946/g.47300  ORF Transcript_16946/g.47300 Transcript_16946/m.47300 type:complete len:239 (+) Transcript_16946:3994-4710(+)
MGAAGLLVHVRLACDARHRPDVQQPQAVAVPHHNLLLCCCNADLSIGPLADLESARRGVGVQKVTDALVVDLQELTADHKLRHRTLLLNAFKQFLNEPWDDPQVLGRAPRGAAAGSHCVGLSTACLPIGKHSGVVAGKATIQQRRHTGVKHLILGGRGPKHVVECEHSVVPECDAAVLGVCCHAHAGSVHALLCHQRPRPERHPNAGVIISPIDWVTVEARRTRGSSRGVVSRTTPGC